MLIGELDLNANPLIHTLHEVSEKIEGFEHQVKKLGAAFGGYYLAYEAIMKVFEGFENVLSLGAHMQSLSYATGESVHDLIVFGHALDITGGSAESAQAFIFKLQNAIAGVNEDGKSTSESLKLLGTSAAELRGMPILDQVATLQKGIAGIGDQATKVAAIKDLFGFRFAAQALPLLSNPDALETARKQAEPLAHVLDENAHKFHELEVAMKGVSINFQSFFAGALEGFAPAATSIADALADIDFVGIGRMVGELLNIFVELMKVFTLLVPVINAVAQALENLPSGSVGGALAGGLLGLSAGPLGAVLGLVAGGFAGGVLGGGKNEEHKGFADAFRNLDDPGSDKSPVSALQKIGLDAGGFGKGGGDALLSENRRQTSLLERIAAAVSKGESVSTAALPV